MKTTIATLALAMTLAAPLAARADDAAAKLEAAKSLVDKTVLKTLDTGFSASLEKTVGPMPPEKADSVRKEARAEFDKQRQLMLDGLSKVYADRFSLNELNHIRGIYDDKVYQKFQAINSDPKSEINLISQAGVTRLLTMLSLIAQGDKPGDKPAGEQQMNRQMQMPTEGR